MTNVWPMIKRTSGTVRCNCKGPLFGSKGKLGWSASALWYLCNGQFQKSSAVVWTLTMSPEGYRMRISSRRGSNIRPSRSHQRCALWSCYGILNEASVHDFSPSVYNVRTILRNNIPCRRIESDRCNGKPERLLRPVYQRRSHL